MFQTFVDMANDKIILKGERKALDSTDSGRKEITGLHVMLMRDPIHVKGLKGVAAYLQALANERIKTPEHWTKYPKMLSTNKEIEKDWKAKNCLVGLDKARYAAVEKLVVDSWMGDKQTTVVVKTIQRIENPALYCKYALIRKGFFERGSSDPVKSLKELGLGEVHTTTLGLTTLDELIIPEVNECYLFHGTRSQKVKTAIVTQGLDFRLGDDRGLFGKAVYLAEAVAKSDGYSGRVSKTCNIIFISFISMLEFYFLLRFK